MDPTLRDRKVNSIPVGILVLLSCLKESGLQGAIFRPQRPLYFEKSFIESAQEIVSIKPKTIGFSTWCHSFPSALLLAKYIKKHTPGIPIVFGGPQASVLDRLTLTEFPYVDYVLRGEAEHTIGLLLKALLNLDDNGFNSIPGLTFRDRINRNTIVVNPPVNVIKSMDTIPTPAYEEIGGRGDYKIDVGRGCPFKCTYCTTNQFFSQSYRLKSPERIISEMKRCYELSVRKTTLGFAHDMFTLNKKFVKDLCEKIILHKKDEANEYKWTCSARTDCVSPEMLKIMAKAGCQAIFFGIESGSVKIQKRIEKNLDLDQAHNIVATSVSLGIETVVSYMAGFPDESKADLETTLRSVLRVLMLGARPQLTLLSVLPGTPIYAECVGKLKYDGNISGFSSANLSEHEIRMVRKHPEIFSSFYYLPNKTLSRDLLIFITDLVNQLPDFIPTILLIRKFLQEDIHKVHFVNHIERKLPDYDLDPSKNPALFFIMDSLLSYLSLITRRGLPEYVWEVFHVDCMKAFLRNKRFRISQFRNVENSHFDTKKEKSKRKKQVQLSEFAKVISTKYDLSLIYSKKANGSDCNRLRKGNYKFAIVARSFKRSSVFKLTKQETNVIDKIESLKGTSRRELKERISGKLMIDSVIDKLIKQGLLENN